MVYSVFLIGESLADHSVLWIPGYRILKCGFIFWLASPRFKAGLVITSTFLTQARDSCWTRADEYEYRKYFLKLKVVVREQSMQVELSYEYSVRDRAPCLTGAQVLYDQAIAQAFRAAEPVVDTIAAQLMKGDFTAVKKELAPAAEALKKFGAESFEKTMTMSAELAKKAKEASEGGAKKD